MKKLIYLFLLLAVAVVTAPAPEASAQTTDGSALVGKNPIPTLAQRRLFARLQAQLRRLPTGSPRVLSLSNRMINLVPDAAVAVVNLATRKLVDVSSAQRLVVLATNSIATFAFPVDRLEVLLVNTSRTVANVAEGIPRIVATSPQENSLSTFNEIIGAAEAAMIENPLISPEITNFIVSNLETATPPPGPSPEPTPAPSPEPTPTPTPTPYGA